MFNGKWWLLTSVLTAALTAGVGWYFFAKTPPPVRGAEEERPAGRSTEVRVEVVRPQLGGMDRTTQQPGTVAAYEYVHLYAEVPGYLKKQNVDIGQRVKRGQVLAEIAVPELDTQVKRCAAAVDQAKARVAVMKARVASAKADLEVAKAGVVTAEASAKSKKALRTLSETELKQMEGLFATRSIEEIVVHVAKEKAEAATETERAARAAITSAEAQVAAAAAKIEQAEADVLDAAAAVKVAEADLEKAQVMVRFAIIVSPYDGVVTQRNFFPGDFVKAANQGAPQLPLLSVERTDKMRVVVQVPDRDVPFTDPGDEAVVEIDALPGEVFKGAVARVADSEDPQTRLMRVEIDLDNPKGKIHQGMYGRVSIILDKCANLLSVPSSSLAGKSDGGKGTVFVVRDGRLHRVAVVVGVDNGVRAAILSGLKADDQVVARPSGSLRDDLEVTATSADEVAQK